MAGEFIAEIIVEGLLGSIWRGIKASIGFIYLYLRYWRPRRVREQLAQRYGSRYAAAGSAVITGLMRGLGVALLVLWALVVMAMVEAAIVSAWRG